MHTTHLFTYHEIGRGYPPLQRKRTLLRQLRHACKSTSENSQGQVYKQVKGRRSQEIFSGENPAFGARGGPTTLIGHPASGTLAHSGCCMVCGNTLFRRQAVFNTRTSCEGQPRHTCAPRLERQHESGRLLRCFGISAWVCNGSKHSSYISH